MPKQKGAFERNAGKTTKQGSIFAEDNISLSCNGRIDVYYKNAGNVQNSPAAFSIRWVLQVLRDN